MHTFFGSRVALEPLDGDTSLKLVLPPKNLRPLLSPLRSILPKIEVHGQTSANYSVDVLGQECPIVRVK